MSLEDAYQGLNIWIQSSHYQRVLNAHKTLLALKRPSDSFFPKSFNAHGLCFKPSLKFYIDTKLYPKVNLSQVALTRSRPKSPPHFKIMHPKDQI